MFAVNKLILNMKRILYFLLKKDIMKRLSEKRGTQFVDDVMAILGMPTDTTNEYLQSLEQKNPVNS